MLRADGNGTLIAVKVTPRAKQNSVGAPRADRLPIHVRAVPEGGAANSAVLKLLSVVLDVPISRCQVVRGHASREKSIRIGELPPDCVRAKLGIAEVASE